MLQKCVRGRFLQLWQLFCRLFKLLLFSGNSAFKLSFAADYTLSKLLTMSFYYDRQTNTPLLSSSSYPTTTQDFGLSLKFSLTR